MAFLQQVAYSYAISPKVAQLGHLLKPTEPWVWDRETNRVFEEAKEVIADRVEDGIRLFDPTLPTGLITGWCQERMAKKHCLCRNPTAKRVENMQCWQ